MSVCEDCIYKKTGSTLCNSCNERNNWYWKKTKKVDAVMSEWISAKDALPEVNLSISSQKVIIAMGVKHKQIAFGWYRKLHYDHSWKWVTGDNEPFEKQELITHWMPLPEPPN
jgi:hypothetical protein